MSYAYRMRCADNFYGEDCSVNCVPVRNDTGIFVCNSNGNSTRVMCTTSSAYATKGAIFSELVCVCLHVCMCVFASGLSRWHLLCACSPNCGNV